MLWCCCDSVVSLGDSAAEHWSENQRVRVQRGAKKTVGEARCREGQRRRCDGVGNALSCMHGYYYQVVVAVTYGRTVVCIHRWVHLHVQCSRHTHMHVDVQVSVDVYVHVHTCVHTSCSVFRAASLLRAASVRCRLEAYPSLSARLGLPPPPRRRMLEPVRRIPWLRRSCGIICIASFGAQAALAPLSSPSLGLSCADAWNSHCGSFLPHGRPRLQVAEGTCTSVCVFQR